MYITKQKYSSSNTYEGYDFNFETNALVNESSVQKDPSGKSFREYQIIMNTISNRKMQYNKSKVINV